MTKLLEEAHQIHKDAGIHVLPAFERVNERDFNSKEKVSMRKSKSSVKKKHPKNLMITN